MERERFAELLTEQKNESAKRLDRMNIDEIVELMNREDRTVADAVGLALPQIARAAEQIVRALKNGGRLVYFGAGTSGRLGVLDASECPPTFGVSPELVQGVIAGGDAAIRNAVENAEDDRTAGERDAVDRLTAKDVAVGIAASGRTPYVLGAVAAAKRIGAVTIGLACNVGSPLGALADFAIEVPVGPEVIAGSTRLKAGTAQKMVLNMLSTATMIKLGKVHGNLMVNVQATNAKLRERVVRIVAEATGKEPDAVRPLCERAGGDARVAILMDRFGIGREQALEALKAANDHFGEALVRLAQETAGAGESGTER